MRMDRPVVIVASDPALRSSLHFALSVEGFDVRAAGDSTHPDACFVIDQDPVGGGLAMVISMRAAGNSAPVILLVTHPDRHLRERAKLLGVSLLEKPLRRDDLSSLLSTMPVRALPRSDEICSIPSVAKNSCNQKETACAQHPPRQWKS